MPFSHYALSHWVKNLLSGRFVVALLSAFGVLWLSIEIASYFSEAISTVVKRLWWLFLLGGLLSAGYQCKPKNRAGCRLSGRDVYIEVAIGNIFDFPGSLIIGTNTTFDTEVFSALISPRSIQGQFTTKYYDNVGQLDLEIHEQLQDVSCTELNDRRLGKKKRYAMGEVVRVSPQGKNAYFVAIAHMNEHGNASGEFEDIKEALAKLWVYIIERGSREEIVIPVLGTGFARIQETREEVIREIIRSFIAACSERVFCDTLTIVISPHDAVRHCIDMDELESFITHVCKYTQYSPLRSQAIIGYGIERTQRSAPSLLNESQDTALPPGTGIV